MYEVVLSTVVKVEMKDQILLLFMAFIVYSCCSCLADIDPPSATCFGYANIYQDKAGFYLTRISGIFSLVLTAKRRSSKELLFIKR